MSQDPWSDVPDEQLMIRISGGDAAALSALFGRRHADVYRVAMLMTGSAAAAEDVTQDVFLAVMRDAARFEPGRATVAAWLCGIARNHARRRLHRDLRMVPFPEESEPIGPESAAAADPLRDLARAQQIESLRRAVLTLPLKYREVVVLCDLQDLSYADAATALACSIGTVRSRLHRGRALLYAKLRANEDRPAAHGKKKIAGCLA